MALARKLFFKTNGMAAKSRRGDLTQAGEDSGRGCDNSREARAPLRNVAGSPPRNTHPTAPHLFALVLGAPFGCRQPHQLSVLLVPEADTAIAVDPLAQHAVVEGSHRVPHIAFEVPGPSCDLNHGESLLLLLFGTKKESDRLVGEFPEIVDGAPQTTPGPPQRDIFGSNRARAGTRHAQVRGHL